MESKDLILSVITGVVLLILGTPIFYLLREAKRDLKLKQTDSHKPAKEAR
jgi:hypothetical protein